MHNHDFRSRFRAPRPLQPLLSHMTQDSRQRPAMLLSDSLLLPHSLQPPPMFGPRGATIPPKFYNHNPHIQTMQNVNGYDEQHWCETCDRGFRTSILLENHKVEHQRCNIDGCTFVAHPKVITKHIQMQHSTGLYIKISKLNDPEEIKKWREERRMKFPTRANIDKKNAAVKEKIERGEKMGLKKTTFPGNSKNWKPNTLNTRKAAAIARRRPKKVEKACPINKAKHNLIAFTGINQLNNDLEANTSENHLNFVIDDEMDDLTDSKDKNTCDTQAYVVCGAINNLITNYGSSDDDDGNLTIDNSKTTNQSIKYNAMSTSKLSLDSTETETRDISSFVNSLGGSSTKDINAEHSDDSSPEEIKTIKTKDQLSLENKSSSIKNLVIDKKSEVDAKPTKSCRMIKKQFKSVTRKVPSTLLEKLLSNEIRHERNVTLQCIRHIIKNNYFEK